MKYLVIHCADTPYDREVTPDDICAWHKGALHNTDGTYTFLGRNYSAIQMAGKNLLFPSGKVVPAMQTNGRGWSQVGYSDLIQRQGKTLNLVSWNMDNVIDSAEVTNGAAGYNSVSRHVCLAGGWSVDGKSKDGKIDGVYVEASKLYTVQQLDSLKQYIRIQKNICPDVIVVGHNSLSTKTCPNFNVAKFLKDNQL